MAARSRFGLLKLLWRLTFLVLLLAGWGLAALATHVVVVPDETGEDFDVLVIPKNRFAVSDTYVDTRGWTEADLAAHENLAARLVEAGKADSLRHLLGGTIRTRLGELLELRRTLIDAQQRVTP